MIVCSGKPPTFLRALVGGGPYPGTLPPSPRGPKTGYEPNLPQRDPWEPFFEERRSWRPPEGPSPSINTFWTTESPVVRRDL